MVKIKTKFICQECGYETPKWLGKCPSCGQWNTFVEEFYEKSSQSRILEVSISKAQKLKEVELKNEVRVSTCIKEFDRVLGGGIVKGSLIY